MIKLQWVGNTMLEKDGTSPHIFEEIKKNLVADHKWFCSWKVIILPWDQREMSDALKNGIGIRKWWRGFKARFKIQLKDGMWVQSGCLVTYQKQWQSHLTSTLLPPPFSFSLSIQMQVVLPIISYYALYKRKKKNTPI